MDDFAKIYELAKKRATNNEHIKMLEFEYKQIRDQGAEQYWVELIKSRKKFKTNKNGLVLPFLLGITTIDPIEGELHLYIEDEDGVEMDGIEISDGNRSITVSPDTMIKIDDKYIKAIELIKNQ